MNNVVKQARCELARRSLWEFQKLTYPEFFNERRPHLKKFANTLQSFLEDRLLKPDGTPYRYLMTNLPPRVGKSFGLTKTCAWALGKNNNERIITVSYNSVLSGDFSRYTRDAVADINDDPNEIDYSDIFPTTKIKFGDASAQKWALEGQFFNYLGTGFGGTITGKGASLGVIDDPIKSAKEAFNKKVLDDIYSFYKNTFFSRLEDGAKVIVNHTRWVNGDLCGRLKAENPNDWYELKMPMEDPETGELLCEDIVSREMWEEIKKNIDPLIVKSNYNQECLDSEGALYKGFNTYAVLPEGETLAYVDTADLGKDYLCSVAYVKPKPAKGEQQKAYLKDVIYTQDGMEVTEPLTANFMINNGVNRADVESNNGGRGFARNVQREIAEKGGKTVIKWFHQSSNKEARINSESHYCQQNIIMPEGWETKFPEFYTAIMGYSREGKNDHDDAPDTLTGVAESCSAQKKKVKIF